MDKAEFGYEEENAYDTPMSDFWEDDLWDYYEDIEDQDLEDQFDELFNGATK